MTDNPPSVQWVSRPKARRPHRCCECRGTIPPGETYERFEGVWDGQFSAYKTCTDCTDLRSTTCPDGWQFGSLYEEVFAHADLIPVFNAIRRKRSAPESPGGWMERREEELSTQLTLP